MEELNNKDSRESEESTKESKMVELYTDMVSNAMTQAMAAQDEQVTQREEEIMKDMITNHGAIYYYDGELADMSKLSIINKSFVIFNIDKQAPVLVNGGVLKLDSRDGALAVCQVLINIYGANLVVYPFEEIKDMGLIL